MGKTRRGVYHNLLESEYAISNNEVAFFFSSMFYLNKFMVGYKQHREDFRKRVERTFINHPLNSDFIADLHFYKRIEKRGFRVVFKGGDLSWRKIHELELAGKINKNTKDWFVMQKVKLGE